MLLIFFWPIMDMLFAIFRRVLEREPIGEPDRLHIHQLIMHGLSLTYFNCTQQNVTNPLATALVLSMTAIPIIAAQFFVACHWSKCGCTAVLWRAVHRDIQIIVHRHPSARIQTSSTHSGKDKCLGLRSKCDARGITYFLGISLHFIGWAYICARGGVFPRS